MKRGASEDGKGGTKKFLYTGPQSKNEDENEWDFTPVKKSKESTKNSFSVEANLEDVWSIKKNVALGSPVPQKTDTGLTLNVGKGFYSRHAALKDEDLNHQNITGNTSPGGRSWSQPNQSRYSYAHTSAAAVQGQVQPGSPSSPKIQQDNMGRLKRQNNQGVQSTSGNVQSTMQNKSRYF
ncbi:uncharacterized protein LOC106177895 isoform X1 [Lingula anatina]|uniref:Uncharacterized protein LOC106177895 isoform X1 n=1 Tax=Lingula anatina TaxID=7574 RepID=A0A1S3K1L8_LINAN|nr:uncharacterized protein LOC106177895 isoform X1 [Lingula anatina]|eukprot:XP_013416289.1 uncharacterized protein LOC106177895 isoform X1 [Lingula anatina]